MSRSFRDKLRPVRSPQLTGLIALRLMHGVAAILAGDELVVVDETDWPRETTVDL